MSCIQPKQVANAIYYFRENTKNLFQYKMIYRYKNCWHYHYSYMYTDINKHPPHPKNKCHLNLWKKTYVAQNISHWRLVWLVSSVQHVLDTNASDCRRFRCPTPLQHWYIWLHLITYIFSKYHPYLSMYMRQCCVWCLCCWSKQWKKHIKVE